MKLFLNNKLTNKMKFFSNKIMIKKNKSNYCKSNNSNNKIKLTI